MTVDRAAAGIEAYFIRSMLSELTRGSGLAGGAFGDMLKEAIADAVADAGGIGIAKELDLGTEIAATRAQGVGHVHAHAHAPRLEAPVEGVISSKFGARRDPIDGHERHHQGLDIAAAKGTPVHAAESGVVARVEHDAGYGNVVVVDHGGGLETRYAHLESASVELGQKLERGQALGTVGSTGRSTGPHLHFEVRRDGVEMDPSKLLWR